MCFFLCDKKPFYTPFIPIPHTPPIVLFHIDNFTQNVI